MKVFKKSRKRGFTLIEITIVMSLVSFLFFTMFGTYASIQNLLHNQTNSARQSTQALNVIAMITNDLNNLYYESWNSNSYFMGNEVIITNGIQADTLKFNSKSQYSNPSTMQTKAFGIKYFGKVNDDTGEPYLFRQEDPLSGTINSNFGIPIPILGNITHFKMGYSRDNRNWKKNWNSKENNKAPPYIKVQLGWNEGGGEREEKILIHPYSIYR